MHSVAFPIPVSVTLETVVHTGKSNSGETAARVGKYKNYKARLSGYRGRGAVEKKRWRGGGGGGREREKDRVRESAGDEGRLKEEGHSEVVGDKRETEIKFERQNSGGGLGGRAGVHSGKFEKKKKKTDVQREKDEESRRVCLMAASDEGTANAQLPQLC